ncbi:hypothetical protein HanXRQr2_Chr02g0050251 [Helianthus annuus]|uniref:Uncharacterized protein n=1 Tax=Helianthus annuus TaxID=4232 RepID=A0A9K3NXR3_HELAN|nr:hypothetical protein HanXRQr2_Chr02g0050251 [Helianthus annuus]
MTLLMVTSVIFNFSILGTYQYRSLFAPSYGRTAGMQGCSKSSGLGACSLA